MQFDNSRGNYNLKESKLANELCRACNVDVHSERGRRVVEWRNRASKNAGNFVLVAEEVLPLSQARQGLCATRIECLRDICNAFQSDTHTNAIVMSAVHAIGLYVL